MRWIALLLVTLAWLCVPFSTIGADAAMMHKGPMSHMKARSGPVKCQADTLSGSVSWSCQRGQMCCFDFWAQRNYCAPSGTFACWT